MNKINKILKDNDIKTNKYTIKNGVYIIDDKYVIKRKNNVNNDLYSYLSSRNFEYYPKLIKNINSRDDYDIYEYINDIKTPNEQKGLDIINLISLLHNQTTFYKGVSSDSYKEIYENVKKQVDDVYAFYNQLFVLINNSIYMSPSEYLIIRNISKIFASMDYCYTKLEEYLEITKDISKQRFATIHNNLSLNHLIKNDKSYLISWDKSKMDIPIYDLFNFYQNNYLDLEFTILLKQYNDKYPLHKEEELLFMILISIPKKIEITSSEIKNTKIINKSLEYIFRSEKIVKYLDKKKTSV